MGTPVRMKSKWVCRLSITFNILVIIAFMTLGLRYWRFYHNSISGPSATDELTSGFSWPDGKKMALSFTFDDAYYSHIDSIVPLFDRYGIKATFYVSMWRLAPREEAWKKAISNGHEIGNHTYNHPCSGNHDFITGNSLEDYTIQRMRFELYSANEFIEEILGVCPVSFAYPCGATFVGRGVEVESYVPLISQMFESGRLYGESMVNPVLCDMAQLPAEELDGKSFDEIKELIETAKSSGNWLILAGHEIGEGEKETSRLSVIEAICEYSKDPSNGIWVDNIHNISSYIREKRGNEPFVWMPDEKNPAQKAFSKLWSKYYVIKSKNQAMPK
jgi:peptidoglycan/xylan/chitin deacetylase (PgdA/CDA1 family)